MSFQVFELLRPKRRRTRALGAFAGLIAGFAAFAGTLTAVHNAAQASDYDFSQSSEDGANFVRIGLAKSVVIKLPAEARDVIVGDPGVVDAIVRTKNTAYLFARSVGQTNIFFFDADGNQIMHIDLEVALDNLAIQKVINRTIPGNKIKVDTAGSNVVLKGAAANAAEAKLAVDLATNYIGQSGTVVNAMTIAEGDQVMLKVKVVEIQRDVLKSFGINFDLDFSSGALATGLSTFNPVLGTALAATASYSSGNFAIDAQIDALENDELLHTLAEPTLTAISGQRAQFLAGGQFPYVTGFDCDDNNNCIRSISYKDFGVKLGFTPFVLSEGRINLKIATEVSEITDADSGTLATRAAETTIELPSGGSMMLAGLIRDTNRQAVTGTPGLKDLPVLGALFRSKNYTSNQSELVVIVTPYIVNAVAENRLADPADNFNNPTFKQDILFGRLNKVYGTPGNHPDGVYHGNVGYIIE